MKSQLEIAIDLAGKWHEGQRYGMLPYFKHLMDVDDWVKARNGVESYWTRAVAYLHDILEDTECGAARLLESGIKEEICLAVALLTKGTDTYQVYLEKIIQNPLAREVKICDTMANLTQSVKKNNAKRIAKYTRQLAILVKGEYFD